MPPEVLLSFDRSPAVYRPGDRLRLRFRVDTRDETIKKAWLEVGWETTGLGTQDSAALLEEEIDVNEQAGPLDAVREITLPQAPISYEGALLKIRWKARIVLVPRRGDEIALEETFRLGPQGSGPDLAMPAPG